MAISLTPPGDPFTPVTVRGRVESWPAGDEAWEVIDRIAGKYLGKPYPRTESRVVALIEPTRQRAGR